MTNNKEYKKGVLQCRSCHNTFHQSDVKKVKTERLGLEIEEGTCPYCGSHTYGLVAYPVDEFDLLYKNGIHRNTNRKLREHLDDVIDEIFIEDDYELKKKQFVREVNTERMATA